MLEGHLTGLSWLYCHCTNTQLSIHHRPRNMSGVVIVRSWKTTKDFGNIDINWPPNISLEKDKSTIESYIFKSLKKHIMVYWCYWSLKPPTFLHYIRLM